MANRNLLLISYVFPPAGGMTVMRALSLAKYLPQNGFRVDVLTARNPAAPVRDEGLLRHVPAEVRVHKAFTPEIPFHIRKRLWSLLADGKELVSGHTTARSPQPGAGRIADLVRRIFCPDPQVVWTRFAVRAASRIIPARNIGAVLVTAPPFSVFLIGNALKRRFPSVRLVSDFRDEWIRFYLTDFEFLRSEYIRRKAIQIERDTILASDLVVAVTQASLEEIYSRHSDQPRSKFGLIPNGYDPEVLAPYLNSPQVRPSPPKDKVIITHIGTAYRTASPVYFLEALRALPEQVRDRIETRFIGRIAETERTLLQDSGCNVKLLGFMPQDQALRFIGETDYLLLTMTNDFSLPGKIFEYLAGGKPILALSPRGGEVDRILQETESGWCVPHDDREAVKDLLLKAFECAVSGKIPLHRRMEAIRRYERPRLAAEYARLMEERLFSDSGS